MSLITLDIDLDVFTDVFDYIYTVIILGNKYLYISRSIKGDNCSILKWPEFLFGDNDISFHKENIQGEWAGVFCVSFHISRLPFCSALCPPWLPATDCIKARPCPSGTDCIQLERGSRRPAGEERTQLMPPFPQHLLSGTQINYLQPSFFVEIKLML